ncbi:MAG TPA: SDR family NAD(P)-dependent oxidoreductase [Acidimicrobiia bacterium]|nr:SDR family NAD(P)-dependent oxidoreductase [Acidimicrobiia bacterium]
MLEFGLEGKRALVAGAGQGIGRAVALGLAEAGARVACIEVDDDRRGEIVAEVHSAGVEAIGLGGDITRRADVDLAVDGAVEAFGGIDVMVDIVGIARWNNVLELTDDDWEASFDLSLRHAFYLAQAAGRVMTGEGATGGALVYVASVSGLFAAPFHAAYGAAKAGLVSLVKTLAVELAGDGVRVNAVAPGAVKTPRVMAATTDERRSESGRSIPLARMGEPEEIAKAALFLASNLASYVTGQTLVVDGGASVKFPLSLGGRERA